jgi:dTDP-4-dehydrorhamnose reductase
MDGTASHLSRQTSKPILITGASGFLGWNLIAASSKEQLACPLRNPKTIQHAPKNVNISSHHRWDHDSCIDLLKAVQPKIVIHTAAISNPENSLRDPDLSREVNTLWPSHLAKACSDLEIPLIHCSTDLVFSGNDGPYEEKAPTAPLNLYGQQKALAEQFVLKQSPTACILRLPLLFGESGAWTRNGLRALAEFWRKGDPIDLFTDEYRTPARAQRIAQFIIKNLVPLCLKKKSIGILHLGGPQTLSRWQMGQDLAQIFQLDPIHPQSCKRAERCLSNSRPKDTSLISHKANSLGFHHKAFIEELIDIRDGGGFTQDFPKPCFLL